MITQNPIIGRSRKKLSGVYCRTLWGNNVIQSCPKPSTTPPSIALQASRAAFKHVIGMANQLSQSSLNELYYMAPVGRSRRHVLTSQLMQAVVRGQGSVSYNAGLVAQIGTNLAALRQPIIMTPTNTIIEIAVSDLVMTQVAETTLQPFVLALSYEMGIAYNLSPLSILSQGMLEIQPIPSTWIGHELYIYPLFPVNVGTSANPIYAPGRFEANN